MRMPKLLIVLIGVAAAGPALAGSPDDQAAAPSVVVLRGSSAPPEPRYTPPTPAPRDVQIYNVPYVLPYYYPYYPSYALPPHSAPSDRPAAAQFHPR